jgi:hypothetical protein
MKFRKLRIAFSVTCLIACALLIALWVRSYSYMDSIQFFGHNFTSWRGQLFFEEGFLYTTTNFDDADPQLKLWRCCSIDILTGTSEDWSRNGKGWAAPFWLMVGVALALSVAPWHRWRFSLRTLLIATTLIAVVLSVIVYFAR